MSVTSESFTSLHRWSSCSLSLGSDSAEPVKSECRSVKPRDLGCPLGPVLLTWRLVAVECELRLVEQIRVAFGSLYR